MQGSLQIMQIGNNMLPCWWPFTWRFTRLAGIWFCSQMYSYVAIGLQFSTYKVFNLIQHHYCTQCIFTVIWFYAYKNGLWHYTGLPLRSDNWHQSSWWLQTNRHQAISNLLEDSTVTILPHESYYTKYTVECQFNAVQYNKIFPTALRWLLNHKLQLIACPCILWEFGWKLTAL